MRVYQLLGLMLALLTVSAGQVMGQDCRTGILLSLARAGSVCVGLERGQICYGNGSAEATLYNEGTFAAPGDIVSANDVQELRVSQLADDISIVALSIQGSLPVTEQRSITLLALGDVTLTDEVERTPAFPVNATGTLNIRATPEINGDIVQELGVGAAVIANGRNEDGDWLRVEIPNTDDLGWVSASVVEAETDFSTLLTVGLDAPYFKPFEVMSLATGAADAFCEGAPESGVLLQSGSTTDFAVFEINGHEVQIAGTVFMQAAPDLRIIVLDGQVLFDENFVPAGAEISAGGEAVPYTFTVTDTLPLNNLPSRFTVTEPLTAEAIAAAIEAYNTIEAEPVVVEVPTATPQPCRRITRTFTDLWSGPGVFYENINQLRPDRSVRPVLQTTDLDGNIWWQLSNSNWMLAADAEVTGECETIPVLTEDNPSPINALQLETCETSNGPLRVGQRVTIEFTPPPWDTEGEAWIATRTDPGTITVDEQRQGMNVSAPIRLGTADDRYLRRFSTIWEATGGNHRIVGEWMAYVQICNITVPLR